MTRIGAGSRFSPTITEIVVRRTNGCRVEMEMINILLRKLRDLYALLYNEPLTRSLSGEQPS